METEINIVEILKDKPQGTKLYSSACGKCELKEADDKSFKVSFYSSKFGFMLGGEGTFDKNGNLYDDGECIIFPSKEMRDWEKFSWKKGDVLSDDGGRLCIFKSFAHSSYLTFKAKLIKHEGPFIKFDTFLADTKDWHKTSDDVAKEYIVEIEKNIMVNSILKHWRLRSSLSSRMGI